MNTNPTTKEKLEFALNNEQIRGILVKGLWGTGKSHLVGCALESKKAIKTSLFGCKNKTEAVNRILAEALNAKESTFSTKLSDLLDAVDPKLKKIADIVSKELTSQIIFNCQFSENPIVVLDDIERISPEFPPLDLFSLANELIYEKKCKVILICNEEKTNENFNAAFVLLRDKIVDYEITVNPTSFECFSIVEGQFHQSKFSTDLLKYLKFAIATCEISNIRVIRHIFLNVEGFIHQFKSVENLEKIYQHIAYGLSLLIGVKCSSINIVNEAYKSQSKFKGKCIEFLFHCNSVMPGEANENEKVKQLLKLLKSLNFLDGGWEFNQFLVRWLENSNSVEFERCIKRIIERTITQAQNSEANKKVDRIFMEFFCLSKEDIEKIFNEINFEDLSLSQANKLYQLFGQYKEFHYLNEVIKKDWFIKIFKVAEIPWFYEDHFHQDITELIEGRLIDDLCHENVLPYLYSRNSMPYRISEELFKKVFEEILSVQDIKKNLKVLDNDTFTRVVMFINRHEKEYPNFHHKCLTALSELKKEGDSRVCVIVQRLPVSGIN